MRGGQNLKACECAKEPLSPTASAIGGEVMMLLVVVMLLLLLLLDCRRCLAVVAAAVAAMPMADAVATTSAA